MKAAFAGALCFRPALLVLDEPFSGLDPLVRDELIQGLLDRIGETTLFLSSHRPGGDRELRQPRGLSGGGQLACSAKR